MAQNEEVVGMVVKLAAESTDFQNQMTTLNRQMKVLQSDYRATASASKEFDNTIDGNKSKIDYISKAIETQASIVEAHSSRIEKTNEKLSKLAAAQSELKNKIDSTKSSYEAVAASQGDESEAAQKLAEELKTLQNEYDKGNTKINATVKTLDNQTINVNKAKEKLNIYNNELSDTKDKLEKLSSEGSKSTSVFDSIKGKFSETASNTKILGVSLGDVAGGLSGGQVASSALGTALGTLASAGITVAIQAFQQLITKVGEFIKSSLKIGETFEAQMSKVEAISGATAGDLTKLTETARKFGASTQYSATESAKALEYMSLAGWNAEQSSDGLSGVLNLAAASAMDLGKASDVVTDYLTSFNMEASESNHLADVMAYAMSHSNTSTEQLAEAYKNCAGTATTFGISLEDTTAWLGKVADNGLKAGEAGTMLNSVLSRIYGQNETAAGALKEYSIAIFDAQGKAREFNDVMKDMQKAMSKMNDEQKDLFMKSVAGTNQLDGFSKMCNTSVDSVDNLSESLEGAAGTAEAMARIMNNNVSGLKKSINSKLEDIGISIYNAVSPIIKNVLNVLDTTLNGLTQWLAPIGNYIHAALNPLSTIVSIIMRIIQLVQNIVIPLLTGPLKLFTSLLNVTGNHLQKIYEVVEVVCGKIEEVMEPIINFLSNVGKKIETIFSSLQNIKGFIVNLYETAKVLIEKLGDKWKDVVKLIVSYTTGNEIGVISSIKSIIEAVNGSAEEIKSIWNGTSSNLAECTDGIEENTVQNFENIADACGLGADHVFTSFEEMYNSIQQLDDETFGKLKESANEYFNEYNTKMDAIQEYSSERLQKEMKGWEECHETKVKDLNYYLEKAEYQSEREAAINRKTAKAKQEIENTYTSALEQELQQRQATIDSYATTTYTNDYKAFAANEEAKTKKAKEEAEKRAKFGGASASIASKLKGVLGAFANGTNYVPYSGSYLVGEKGPELVTLPRGAGVKTNSQTQSILGDKTNSILEQILQQNAQNNKLISKLQDTLSNMPDKQLRLAREKGYSL